MLNRYFRVIFGMAFVALALVAAPIIFAQTSASYDLSWNVLGGGGEQAASASYSLEGTLGQPIIDAGSSATFAVQPGYWGGAGAASTAPFSGKLFLPLAMRDFSTCFTGPQEIEPNSLIAQANGPLCSGTTYVGYHDGADDDRDYFSVTLNVAGTITVDLTNIASSDAQLQLFYPTAGSVPNCYAGAPPYHLICTTSAGTYYVRVYTPAGYSATTPYNLVVTYP
jgi:hypothetical protein